MSPASGARHLQDELSALRSRLLEMSTSVEELLGAAIEALGERDAAKAQAVILGDREIDALELELDEVCIHLLALQQPVARDLRFITMAMRISNDLESIGDHAVNIAEAVEHLIAHPAPGRFRELEEMARIARQMLVDALDSFIRGDAAAAREVCRRDDEVDRLQDSLTRILLTHMMEDPRRIGAAMSLILTSRNLERLGARAIFAMARTGSAFTNGSGDYAIAFSVPRTEAAPLANDAVSPLFLAAIEATEEAIYNSLLRATDVTGRDGHHGEALPIDRAIEILRRYGAVR
jgi:phosphate transport system protein